MKQDFIRDNPLIIQALRENQNKKADALMEAAENLHFPFSPAFEQRMERLIRAQRKPYYPLVSTRARKTMLALAAVLILLTTLVFSVSALRVPVIRFIVETYEKFSAIFFVPEDDPARLPETVESIYIPHWLPEGYTFDEAQSVVSDSQAIHLFVSQQGDAVLFQQYTLTSAGLGLNTEGVPSEEILVGEYLGICCSNLGSQTILWENGQYGFSLEGPVDKEVLLRMACSVKEK